MSSILETTPEAAQHELSGEMRYIARQPILNLRGQVHGYALLFDTGSDGIIGGRGRDAARTILDDVVLFGLERLTGGLQAFIKCTSEALIQHLVAVLAPETTVLNIPESVKATPQLMAACRQLKEAGFRFALVDFTGNTTPHPLLELVDYVKVDLTRLGAPERWRLLQQLQGFTADLVAERVDTQEDFRTAVAEGFTYFQGLYFCYPQLIPNAKVPANRLFHIEILRQMQADPLDMAKICPLIMRDASLVFRLLRLVNSPICAIRQEVDSVESAIMILGETTFRRIANLAILREMNAEQPAELLHMALVRARFCELAAGLCQQSPKEQYLLGMLSLLPAMLRCPMETLAPKLPLRAEIREALLGAAIPERCLLGWIEAHERNQYKERNAIAEAYGLNEQRLDQFYVDAIVWDATTIRNAV
ncbi:MAG: HDOD domain-containing protein [Terracidiphilus sp.]|jgi:EAL and modified HD-GYP domain-containing signal transduction protein